MRLARALELTHNFASTPNSIEGLDSLLDPSLVEQALEQAGVATLCKRRLPLQMMPWCVRPDTAEIERATTRPATRTATPVFLRYTSSAKWN